MENYQKAISFDNFFIETAVTFKGCKVPKREPDYVSYSRRHESLVSSRYWYGTDSRGQYVIRSSDHWKIYFSFKKGKRNRQCKKIASCDWHLKSNKKSFEEVSRRVFFAGKAYLNDFVKL